MMLEVHEECGCFEEEGKDAGEGMSCMGKTSWFLGLKTLLDCFVCVKGLAHY